MHFASQRAIRANELATNPDARKQLGAALAHRLLSLPEAQKISLAAVYAAIGGEPPTDQIRQELRRINCETLLPYAHPLGHLEWVVDKGERLIPGPMGIPVPNGEFLATEQLGLVRMIVLPALAVAKDGTRLGRGAGYYDRALADIAPFDQGGPLRVVLIYEEELIEELPSEEHDQKVDVAITPNKVWRVSKDSTGH